MMPDNLETNDLNRVRKGMTVYDARGEVIGAVETVFVGNGSTDSIEQNGNISLADSIADVFMPDDLPRELGERLLNSGYVRLDTEGLLAPDRYIMPEQISSVTADSVRLRVSVDDLPKR